MTAELHLVPQPEDRPASSSPAATCDKCGRRLRIIMEKIRPHRTKPGFEMYEVFARCARPIRGHSYVSWQEHDPRTGNPLPPPRFVAEG
jgi:hypothetical protein